MPQTVSQLERMVRRHVRIIIDQDNQENYQTIIAAVQDALVSFKKEIKQTTGSAESD